MRTPKRTASSIVASIALLAAGLLIGMYAGGSPQAAAGPSSQLAGQARADFPLDPDQGGPGPTDPNGPAH